MQAQFILFLVLNVNKVYCFTTGSRSYDLHVPGSDPIRIIEAEPLWDRNPQEVIVPTTQKTWTGFEHRALIRPTIQTTFHTKTHNPYVEDNENEDSMEQDSSEELKTFLKRYAEKVKRPIKSSVIDNYQPEYDSSEKFHKVELITKPSEEPTNRLANIYLDKDKINFTNSKGWNMLNAAQIRGPFDDKNGWVSMEVVPWSVSKVAKWHSNAPKPVHGDNKYSNPAMNKPLWKQPSKPVVNYRPGSTSYYAKPYNNYGILHGNNNKNHNKQDIKVNSHTSSTYGQNVYVQQDYADEMPRPPWTTQDDQNDQNYEHFDNQGIITDGQPANFPKQYQENNRRKGSMSEEQQLPPSHPLNGDGEWVLLTTTKGYKAPTPHNRQRSLDIETDDPDTESISTHKSVRLTVLPPLKESKINMTTSHGGLLQVESTFQTVEEAQKQAFKKQNIKRKVVKRRRPLKQSLVDGNGAAAAGLPTRKKGPNPSSVMAAVGAGMIPATMAMLVPMMGRRKRRDVTFPKPLQVLGFEYGPKAYSF